MGPKPRKNTRVRKARARKRTERPVPPAVRVAAILKMFNERAYASPSSPLVHGSTPQEVVKNCRELAEWLYAQAWERTDRERGSQHVYLMLVGALNFLERELKPVFEVASDIAKGVRK